VSTKLGWTCGRIAGDKENNCMEKGKGTLPRQRWEDIWRDWSEVKIRTKEIFLWQEMYNICDGGDKKHKSSPMTNIDASLILDIHVLTEQLLARIQW